MATGPNPSSRGGRVSLSEINVTPLVDVMLVLLIVFMVSAPLLQQGVEVNLPKADAGNLARSEEPVMLTIRRDSSLDLDQKPISFASLPDRLASLSRARPDLQILVQADQSIPYGEVARVMAALKKANIHRVGLVTAPESPGQK